MSGNLSDLGSMLNQYIESDELKETAQTRFERTYVTTAEVMERVGVTRPAALTGMKTRFTAVYVGNAMFWERTDEVEDFINVWSLRKHS